MYDKCKTCKHRSLDGRPIYENSNCAECLIKGNYAGYQPKLHVNYKYKKLFMWICLIFVHTLSIIACVSLGVYISLLTLKSIWLILSLITILLIDVAFAYFVYLFITSNYSNKKR